MVWMASLSLSKGCLWVLLLSIFKYVPVTADETATFGNTSTAETMGESGNGLINIVLPTTGKIQNFSSEDTNQTASIPPPIGNDTYYTYGDFEYEYDFMELLLSLEEGQVSRSTYEYTSRILWLCLAPCLSIPGIIGNILALRRTQKEQLTQSFRLYLTFLLVADIAVLILAIIQSLVTAIGLFDIALYSYVQLKVSHIRLPINDYALGLCCLSTMYLSIERVVVVSMPIKSKFLNLTRTAKAAITISLFANMAFFEQFFEFKTVPYFDTTVNATLYIDDFTEWAIENEAVLNVFKTVKFAVLKVTPVVFTLTFNMVLIMLVARVALNRKLTFGQTQNPEEQKKNRKMALILCYVSFGQIFGHVFREGVFMWYLINPEFDLYMKEHYLFLLFMEISDILSVFNAANDCLGFVFSKRNTQQKNMKQSRSGNPSGNRRGNPSDNTTSTMCGN